MFKQYRGNNCDHKFSEIRKNYAELMRFSVSNKKNNLYSRFSRMYFFCINGIYLCNLHPCDDILEKLLYMVISEWFLNCDLFFISRPWINFSLVYNSVVVSISDVSMSGTAIFFRLAVPSFETLMIISTTRLETRDQFIPDIFYNYIVTVFK